jgi:hypothetical protein
MDRLRQIGQLSEWAARKTPKTVANAGIIDSIYIGYNGFDDTDDTALELSVNGEVVASGIFLDGSNFRGDQGSDNNTSPVYWMQLDLSGDPVAVSAGLNNFSLTATAESEGGGTTWIFAPMRNTDNPYAGGQGTGLASSGDSLFAVTVVPEPGSRALVGLGLGMSSVISFTRRKRKRRSPD